MEGLRDEVYPRNIFFSLEQFQDCYLQLWHLSEKGDLQAPHLCRIITNKMCTFDGDVIHSGRFRIEVSTGNFRAQLIFTRKCHYDNFYPWQDAFYGDFQYITPDQIKQYKFQIDTNSNKSNSKNTASTKEGNISCAFMFDNDVGGICLNCVNSNINCKNKKNISRYQNDRCRGFDRESVRFVKGNRIHNNEINYSTQQQMSHSPFNFKYSKNKKEKNGNVGGSDSFNGGNISCVDMKTNTTSTKKSSSLAQSSSIGDQSDSKASECEDHSFKLNYAEINDDDLALLCYRDSQCNLHVSNDFNVDDKLY